MLVLSTSIFFFCRGNLCVAQGELVDRWAPVNPVSDVERKVIDREMKVKLFTVILIHSNIFLLYRWLSKAMRTPSKDTDTLEESLTKSWRKCQRKSIWTAAIWLIETPSFISTTRLNISLIMATTTHRKSYCLESFSADIKTLCRLLKLFGVLLTQVSLSNVKRV